MGVFDRRSTQSGGDGFVLWNGVASHAFGPRDQGSSSIWVVDLFLGTETLTVRWFPKKKNVGCPKVTQNGWGSAWSNYHGRAV